METPPARLLRMLESLGLDPALASSGELQTIMSELRNRCHACQAGNTCDNWLEGRQQESRDFCPNARALDILRKLAGAD